MFIIRQPHEENSRGCLIQSGKFFLIDLNNRAVLHLQQEEDLVGFANKVKAGCPGDARVILHLRKSAAQILATLQLRIVEQGQQNPGGVITLGF